MSLIMRWSDREVEFLKENYPSKGRAFCANKLNKSESSIRSKASKLGLKRNQKTCKKFLEGKLAYYEFISTSEYKNLENYKSSSEPILHQHSCGHKWKVSPNNLRKLVGCPACSTTGKKDLGLSYLYFVYFPSLGLYKFGVTNNWNKRKYNFGCKPELISLEVFSSGVKAYEEESKLKGLLTDYLHDSGELKNGNTETFLWPS